MPEIEVKDRDNNTVEKIILTEDIFGVRSKQGVLHEAVVNYLANQRQGTHATKTRGMVRGGGKKPWRQKHTGRARAGSIRSPIWRGGGITFGPQPRDYSYKLPKKMKRRALLSALNERLSDGEVTIINDFSIDKPKTKEMLAVLKNLGLQDKSVIIVLPAKDDKVMLSARNIPGVIVRTVADLNTYDILAHSAILMKKDAVRLLEEMKKS